MIRRSLFLIVLIVILQTAGCVSTHEQDQDSSTIIVSTYTDQDGNKVTQEIHDQESIGKLRDILSRGEWKQAHVTMDRREDYSFRLVNLGEGNVTEYLIWSTLDGKQVELVIPNKEYVRLNPADSSSLQTIVTGLR